MFDFSNKFLKSSVLVLSLFAGSSAHAQSARELVQQAEELLKNASDAETAQQAEDLLFEAVDKNNVKALFVLGGHYVDGDVLAKDEERGLAMILEAAALGFKPASLFLFQYYQGNGDYDAAVNSLGALAAEGDLAANDRLARFYASGPETVRDIERAQSYLQAVVAGVGDDVDPFERTAGLRVAIIRAQLDDGQFDINEILSELELLASKNVQPALSILYRIYTGGLYGVEADPGRGVGYIAKAESLGNSGATFALGQEFIRGTNLEGDVERGIELLEKAVERGQDRANVTLAALAVEGKYGGMNREEAVAILSQAADGGNTSAAKTLVRSYSSGSLGEGGNEEALKLARDLAESGDDESSQILLADTLLQPNASGEQIDEAVGVLDQLAEEGSEKALVRLIGLYLDDEIVPRNQQSAEKYISQLVPLASGSTKKFLADLYLSGDLLEPDPVLGMRYITEAYNEGVASAVVPYARIFIDGEVVPQAPEKGIEILQEAADAGNQRAKLTLASLFLEENKEYTDKTKGYALLEAIVYETESSSVPFRLGRAYLRGEGVSVDITKALSYLEEASERGHSNAPFFLGREYLQGNNVGRDYRRAEKFFELAVERGNNRALTSLGDVYWRNRNNRRALELYQAAADQGDETGTIKIGLAYMNPSRSPGKQAEGIKILEDLSAAGSSKAALELAKIYRNGRFSLATDFPRALAYYDAALNAGNETAAGQRLSLLAEINSAVEDFEKISLLYEDLTEEGQRSFVFSGFKNSERQIAFVTQKKLQKLGYYSGPLDGLFGRGSQAAMLRFCQEDAFNGPCATQNWGPENAFRVLKHHADET